MTINSFRSKKFEDHVIVDENELIVGHIRVKPSGILWAPADGKRWYGVSLAKFSKYMIENGTKQKK